MAQITGLDIGARGIRAVQLDSGTLKVSAVEHVPLVPGDPPWEAVKGLFAKGAFNRKQVWASLNDRECLARDLTVPFTSAEQIKQTIRFSAEEVIPDDVESYLLDHHVIETGEAESQLMVVAARRDALENKLKHLQDVGVDPVGLGFSGLALYNLGARIAAARELKDPFLILDVGASTADVIVGDAERLRFVRSILIHREGHGDGEPLGEERLERLFREVKRTLWSGGVDGHAEVAWICGGLSDNPGIVDLVTEAFDMEAEVMPVHEVVSGETDKLGGADAQAVGLALIGSQGAKLPFAPNFRREEFVRRPAILRLRWAAAVLLLALMVGVFLDGYRQMKLREQLNSAISAHRIWEWQTYTSFWLKMPATEEGETPAQAYERGDQDAFLRHQPKRDKNPRWLISQLHDNQQKISEDLTVDPKALVTLKELTRHLQDFPDLELTSIDIERYRVNFRGVLPDAGAYDRLISRIRSHAIDGDKGYFSRFEATPTQKEQVEFRITMSLNRKYIQSEGAS